MKLNEKRLWSITSTCEDFNEVNFNNRVLREMESHKTVVYKIEDYISSLHKAIVSYCPHAELEKTRM